MQIIQLPIALALGLTVFEPESSEAQKLPILPEVAWRVISRLPLKDVSSLLLTSKTWRMLSLAVLQSRYQNVRNFTDALFVQGCSNGAFRVARQVMQAPCKKDLVFRFAAWSISNDHPEQIPEYYRLAREHTPAITQDRRWCGIKAALAEGGNLMPLLLLVVPQVQAIKNEADLSVRNMLLSLEYGYVKSCWAKLAPQAKQEKKLQWLKKQDMSPKAFVHSLLQIARMLLEIQQELRVQCEDIVQFLFELDLDEEKRLNKDAFFEVMIEETASYPHFAAYCIQGLLQGGKFESSRRILYACRSMSIEQRDALQETIDIQEAEALSIKLYEQNQEERVQKQKAAARVDDEEFFNALDELNLSD